MEKKIYTLRKIHPNNWSGIRLYNFANEDIGCALDQQGLPITGLTEDEYVVNAKGNKELVKGTRVQVEEAMGLEPGTLKKGSSLKPNDFWVNFSIRVGLDDVNLDNSIPEHRLKIEFLKAQPQVAYGVSNIKAKSEYVLFTKEEEAVNANKEKKVKRIAFSLFEKLTLDDMCEILEILGIRSSSLSREVVEDRLSDYMEEYPNKFIAIVEDPNRKHKTFVRKALDKGVLNLENGAVMFNEIVIGYDVDSAAAKLLSEESAKTLEAIKENMKH